MKELSFTVLARSAMLSNVFGCLWCSVQEDHVWQEDGGES
jgi:hypothetical protein